MRASGYMGSITSVFEKTWLGSITSVRATAFFGSIASVRASSHMGSSMSVRDAAWAYSTLSVRGMTTLGSYISVFDWAMCGSNLSIRNFAKIGGKCSVVGDNNDTFYIGGASLRAVSDQLAVYGSGSRKLQTTTGGGTLHGVWTADNVITTSDGRKKQNVVNLEEHLGLNKVAVEVPGAHKKRDHEHSITETSVESKVATLLSSLRPVSYEFKTGPEAKTPRYGFIAQELERVLPGVVHTQQDDGRIVSGEVAIREAIAHSDASSGVTQSEVSKRSSDPNAARSNNEALQRLLDDESDFQKAPKFVQYQDLLAVLTMALKMQQKQISELQSQVADLVKWRAEVDARGTNRGCG